MDIFQWYELSISRSGVAYVPYADASFARFGFSTRHGNAIINWGNGSIVEVAPSKNQDATTGSVSQFTDNYSPNYTGNVSITIKQGLKDVYSIWLGEGTGATHPNFNIQDFGIWIKQFTNLYSIRFSFYSYQNPTGKVIKGDLAAVPDSVERINVQDFEIMNNGTDVWFNISSFNTNSKLKWFLFQNVSSIGLTKLKLLGDVSKLPIGCTYFNFAANAAAGTSITYTAGKVWASSFDTLYLPIPLTYSENDALLNDVKNSVTSLVGGKSFFLGNGYRTSASDAAVTYITGLGGTVSGVSVITPLKILDLDFQNNFTDTSPSALTMVAGGTSNQPTFALSGRKAGEYCAVFNGSQSVKTTTNLPVNSDKVTIAFWIKSSQNAVSFITELSTDSTSKNAFYLALMNTTTLRFGDRTPDITRDFTYSAGWQHFVITVDKVLDASNTVKIYKNGIRHSETVIANNDNSGNFINDILFIGQRAGSSLGFNGSLTKLKIYNYPFTPSEVTTLYNSEL